MAANKTNITADFGKRESAHSHFLVKYIIGFLFLISILFTPLKLFGQADAQNLEYKIKAAYLYNFTKFVSWPEEVLAPVGNTTFNLCILKHNPFGHALDLLRNKMVQGLVLTTEITESQEDLDHCQIVYFPKSMQENYVGILEQLAEKNILTVSDISGFANNGGHIGLYEVKGKVRFDINLGAAKSANLKVSAKLLELAIKVIE